MRVLRGERHETCVQRGHLAFADIEALLGQHHDAAALRRFVGQRSQLRDIGQLLLGDARRREEAPPPGGCRG